MTYHPPPPVLTPSSGHHNPYGWQVGGTHSTRMLSYLEVFYYKWSHRMFRSSVSSLCLCSSFSVNKEGNNNQGSFYFLVDEDRYAMKQIYSGGDVQPASSFDHQPGTYRRTDCAGGKCYLYSDLRDRCFRGHTFLVHRTLALCSVKNFSAQTKSLGLPTLCNFQLQIKCFNKH